MVAVLELSSTPRFCGTCHVMSPYFESWRTSSHNEVACVDCHIPPGVTAEFRKKYEAVAMVARYFTGTYGTNPWTEIDDASCLSCHEKRLLIGQELYQAILFDHAPHLTEMRRGKKLRCTSCHSQIVQGSHIAVTSSTCVLCHFKDQPLNQGTARCTLCHQVPDMIVERASFRFDHGDVVRFAMDCESCHAGSVRGDGDVPSERCLTCHNQPARLAELDNVDLLHRMHVTEHKVDCTNCHLEIQHGLQMELETASPDCGTCHERGHSPQQQLYAGIGGRGVDPLPSAMYLSGIHCEGCHLDLPGRDGEGGVKADDIACMSCHGPKYRKIYFRWKKAVDERTMAIKKLIGERESLFRRKPSQSFNDALHNYRLVERGRGIHNVSYSFRLLDEALDQLNEGRRERGASPLRRPWPRPPYESSCFACHQGIERQTGRAYERGFAHTPHVLRAGIVCRNCHMTHDERPEQEHLRFGAEGCSSCHHGLEERECLDCHSGLFDRYVGSELGEFPHRLHVEDFGLGCTDCHESRPGGSFARSREICADCHD
jgi:nitrate/TMAO reductase-like tetraheme cytochrome c subunit